MSSQNKNGGFADAIYYIEQPPIGYGSLLKALSIRDIERACTAGVSTWDALPTALGYQDFIQSYEGQPWAEKGIRVLLIPKEADKLLGKRVIGDYKSKVYRASLISSAGKASLYADNVQAPAVQISNSVIERKFIIGQLGAETGFLENQFGTGEGIDVIGQKLRTILYGLEVLRNDVAFRGGAIISNALNASVFGVVNEPSLAPVLAQVDYSKLDFKGKYDDIINKITQLCMQMNGVYSDNDELLLALPLNLKGIMEDTHQYTGKSLREMLLSRYTNMRIEFFSSLQGVSGGKNMAILVDARFNSSDGTDFQGSPWYQVVADQGTALFNYNVEARHKMTYINKLGGVFVAFPSAIIRWVTN